MLNYKKYKFPYRINSSLFIYYFCWYSFFHCMKRHQYTRSAVSTNAATPFQTPFRSDHHHGISPIILKQKLLLKTKEKPFICAKSTCRTKERYNSSYGKLAERKQINWIIYNILVGIYKNWLRLAPYIMRFLADKKGDMLKDVQKMIENAIKQKQRIQQLLNKFKNKFSLNRNQDNFQCQQTDRLLQQIENLCNKLKVSTKLFSGQILTQKRPLKTQKQNQLADNLFDCMDKYKGNFHFGKLLYANDLSKVVETIIDRIAVVKYMRKNKIKINQSLLKPLKNIFIDDHSFQDQQNVMTATKVIQKLKARFSISNKSNPKQKNQKILNTQKQENSNQKVIYNRNNANHTAYTNYQKNQNISNADKQKKQFKSEVESDQEKFQYDQNQIDQQGLSSSQTQGALSLKQVLDRGQKSQAQLRTKKKMGVFMQSQQNQSEIEQKHHIKSRKYLQKFGKRRVIFDKQNKNKKMKQLINDLKNEQNQKNSAEQKSKTKKKISKNHEDSKFKQKNKQKSLDKSKRASLKIQQKNMFKKSSAQSSQKVSNNSIGQIQSESDESDFNGPNNNKKTLRLKSRNYIKPAKLLKKKLLKRSNNLFQNFDLQNFDMELQAQSNVVNKKKKILNLFKNLQNSGLIQIKSIKKIVANAKKLESQLNINTKQRMIRKNKGQGSPITSFFMIPQMQQAQKLPQQEIQQQNIYQYLTLFNKQAIKNWFTARQFIKNPSLRLQQFQRSRFSGIDYDLDIAMLKKSHLQNNKKSITKWFDKQLISLGLNWVKEFNINNIKQKSINIERENVVL